MAVFTRMLSFFPMCSFLWNSSTLPTYYSCI
uniref:Uncharacterized protein n=1 Tax=Anguilla anguilla TaxID=7936 RepID=A0A0E9RMA0_ANGAN